jgi:ABC-type polysaccharide/polyol phosphate transport system ATPase subunit
VRDVSFEVERGEALGIIGHNGAGKSTILKLLSSITAPTKGEIAINGRLSSLIEVGSGFHPELTGRENVYLNGTILGMSRREITDRMDSIIEFAGVAQFIDTPVKRYSSGMYVRLGFSVCAHLNPDILLLDEVLAVGDGAFQSKCLDRVNSLKVAGTTIVFISHNLAAIERLCDRVILLNRGEVIAEGPPRKIIAEYERIVVEGARPPAGDGAEAGSAKSVEIGGVTFYDGNGQQTTTFSVGDPVRAEIAYTVNAHVDDVVFEASFYSVYGHLRCKITTEHSGETVDLSPGMGLIEFFCPELGLLMGTYHVEVLVRHRDKPSFDNIDAKRDGVLSVDQAFLIPGGFYMPHAWKISHDGSVLEERRMRSAAARPEV